MDVTGLVVMLAGLSAGVIAVWYLIAADRTRFLIRFELSQWREKYYLRALPNFLQSLHENHFVSPFPRRHNAVAAAYFRFRTWRLQPKRPANLRRAFIHQHIVLFGLLEVIRPFIRDFVLNEQQRIVGDRVVQMEDTIERDQLMTFLQTIRTERAAFFGGLTQLDRAILAAIIDRRIIPTLRAAHAIYQEHGFSLLPEFTQLREWREMPGAELVRELPNIAGGRMGLVRRHRQEEREVA